jgi:hypothetical protein
VKLPSKLRKLIDKTSSPHGCWLWIGSTLGGYGIIKYRNKSWFVTRLVWTLLRGPIPIGKETCHDCPGGDNKLCCNPDHLWLGNHRQNQADMVAKGRSATGDRNGSRLYPERRPRGVNTYSHLHPEMYQGEKNGNASVTEDTVRAIRRRTNTPVAVLAKIFGLKRSQVYIIAHRSWRHVK